MDSIFSFAVDGNWTEHLINGINHCIGHLVQRAVVKQQEQENVTVLIHLLSMEKIVLVCGKMLKIVC